MVIQPIKPWMFFVIGLILLALGLYFLVAWLLEVTSLCEYCSGYATSAEALNMGASLLGSALLFLGVAKLSKKLNK